jgi:deoxyribodipyrimidine photo-lyase
MTIFWFRRDLRWDDNAGLFAALRSDSQVLPIFIFDPFILSQLSDDDPRVTFIHQSLQKLNEVLAPYDKSIAVFFDSPEKVFEKLIATNPVSAVYVNHDYEPYARKRDKDVHAILKAKGIDFFTAKDQVIYEKSEIVKDDGSPYVVYTPYSKKWMATLATNPIKNYPSETLLNHLIKHEYPFLSIETIGFKASSIKVPSYTTSDFLVSQYESRRNFPAVAGTSLVGTYLRFGTISIRKLVQKAQQFENKTYLKELIWRDFFMQILWHFPHTVQRSFKPKYDNIVWLNDVAMFQKWCEGNTGYPFVDAGMRELNATGFMHNRVRMIVASFLCKHLLIDWRWGEAYFAQKLLDFEQSSNVGNWQWAAGSGVDAVPYFRIFNPSEQIKKFDNDLEYIKKWVPEFDTLTYPKPIIDHKFARARCLTAYKEAVG